jgi:hypothetical protein
MRDATGCEYRGGRPPKDRGCARELGSHSNAEAFAIICPRDERLEPLPVGNAENSFKSARSSYCRHGFVSHALAGGRTLVEVRDAAGHSNVSITSAYLHVAFDDEALGSLFGFEG